MSKINNITGQVFGRLTVSCLHPIRTDKGRAKWVCICSCGETVTVDGSSLRRGLTKSCGCISKEVLVKRNSTHGKTHSTEYSSWQSAKDRCYNQKNIMFHRYGGRGITVCEKWINSFEAFYKDMGDCPKGMSLDRINGNKGYYKGNCRWATKNQQNNNRCNNKYITYKGKTLSYAQWSKRLGGGQSLVQTRIFRGWTEERAVTTHVK